MTYYPKLKDLREDNDLTQEEVATILNTTYQYYNKYETGKIPITFEKAIILAKYYKVSLTDKLQELGRESRKEIREEKGKGCFNTIDKIQLKDK
jgi:transcriptional regulator with XRE-family HTH domain